MKKDMQAEKLPENLVALIYCPSHSSYPEVTTDLIAGLTVNLEKKTWSYKAPGGGQSNRQLKKIGEHDYFAKDNNSGVIGVYDRNNEKHLTSMVRDWHTTQENKHTNWNFVD